MVNEKALMSTEIGKKKRLIMVAIWELRPSDLNQLAKLLTPLKLKIPK